MQNYFSQFNPYITPQQRVNYYEQNYPQYNQAQNNGGVIPVSTIEEARAFIVDIHGTPTFFYNGNQKEVYLKQTNKQTGHADFYIFAKAQEQETGEKKENNINSYEKDFKAINEKIDGLYSILNSQKEEKKEKTIITPKGEKNVK